ncbi:SDR family NAD(P)-dependent oxidoreductase [Enhygromyxa salina]|uniref:Sulfoacetaldehyde reductase n=1 Tax=Enhygromyxa salina TaxID=215803 RepID=A0A2S9YN11_9BACT|nr:SDR family NAD(P)-dependent oxidoreductase [Enhygromyxa salina]PRQ06483.1 Sulfoacetaldehyde reductase [Enhygromyxa salina]
MVTGASSGIGAAFARRLASEGFNLILVARREPRLRSLAEQLESQHRVSVGVHVADLTDPEQLAETEAQLLASEHFVLLINCAGMCRMGAFARLDVDCVESHVRLNAMAPARLTHAALRRFGGDGPAAIINVSSIAATMATPHGASYCATKAMLSTLTACIAGECVGTNIRIQDLRAGLTRTDFPAQAGVRTHDLPDAAWASPDEVVTASLRALTRNQVVCVPRVGDRLVPHMMRMLPRRLANELGRFTASGDGT